MWSRFMGLVGKKTRPVVPVVRFEGSIQSNLGGGPMPQQGISLQKHAPLLEKAFKTKNAVAVAVAINSPGGSPTQSSLLFQRIQLLKKRNGNLPVHAFVEDIGASGGYFLACAADSIVCDENSIIGSIGVVRTGFGLKDAISRIGVERRVQAVGKNKVQMDPFLDESENDLVRMGDNMEAVHQNFIDIVRRSRGSRLNPELAASWNNDIAVRAGDKDYEGYDGAGLFDGTFYDGKRSIQLGLADELGEIETWLRNKYDKDDNLEIKHVKKTPGWLTGDFGSSLALGGSVAMQSLVASVRDEIIREEASSRYNIRS